EPARGLADRAARSSSPDAEGLRARALYRDRLAGRRSDAGRVAGGVRMSAYSETVHEMGAYLEPVIAQFSDLALERLATQPGACDFRFGNPQEMPLPAIERALTKWVVPENKDWFAYKFSDPHATRVAVDSLRERVGIDFDQRDIAMTTGAFGALAT